MKSTLGSEVQLCSVDSRPVRETVVMTTIVAFAHEVMYHLSEAGFS